MNAVSRLKQDDASSVASLDFSEDPLDEKDIGHLDDFEFGIPEFSELPTLDDVLSETFDFSPVASPARAPFNSKSKPLERYGSMSSFGSYDSLQPAQHPQSSEGNASEYSVIKHVKLKGVSANILSAHKRNAGYPSAMAVNKIVAIGTTFGYLLLFDNKQLLRFFLQPPDDVGGVSAISLNNDSSRVLAGHEKGTINMWDTDSGKVLRSVSYSANVPILHIKFTDDPTKAVMSNAAGFVVLLSFRRPLGLRVCDFRAVFSGSDVVCLEPLLISNSVANHSLNTFNPFVIAMATLNKFFIVVLRPKLSKIFAYPLEGHETTLPVISWQFIKLQVNQSAPVMFEPVVLFGRDSKIVFALLETTPTGANGVRILKTLNLGYSLTNLIWFNNKTIAVCDQKEFMHLMDIQSEESVESVDLQSVQLVYATSVFKGLASETKNSPSLVSASAFACYYSATMVTRQLLLLGQQSLHVFVIRTWFERVNVLKKSRCYSEAIALSREVFQGTCKAVVGPLGPEKAFLIQSTKDLLMEYSLFAVNSAPQQGSIDILRSYFAKVVPVVIETCCLFSVFDYLNEIYVVFEQDISARSIFLQSVQSCVLQSRISKVSPAILKDLVNENIEMDEMHTIQSIILKLDISTIDIDQVVKLSWQNKLFDAIIYLYNRAIKNYSLPLEELTEYLRCNDRENRELVNTILLYLSCCMTGRDYIYGDIPESMQRNAKIQSWKFLLFDQPNAETSDRFPNSKLLLLSDTREFLNVLSIAFGEPEFTTPEGQRVRQRIIDMLMLLVDTCSQQFSPAQLGSIYVFLARELMKCSLNLDPEVFGQVVSYLTSTRPELRATKVERERVVTELLISGVLSIDDEDLEEKLLAANFYSVLEYMYEKRGEYYKMLRCFCQVMSNERGKSLIFRFIRSVLYQMEQVTEEQKTLLINEINHNINILIQIDPTKAAQLLLVELKLPVERVTKQLSLDHDSQVVFQFLSGVVELIARDKITSSSGDNSAIEGHQDEAEIEERRAGNEEGDAGKDRGRGQGQWVRNVVWKYMKLAAVLDVEALERFVRHSSALSSIEDAMQICHNHNLGHLIAYLHLRSGNHLKAMKCFVEYVDKLIRVLLKLDSESEMGGVVDGGGGGGGGEEVVSFECVERMVNKCAKMLREMITTFHVNEKHVQDAWFSLLDAVVSGVKVQVQESGGGGSGSVVHVDRFKHVLFSLLNSMIGYISLPNILTKVFADPAYDSGTYDDVRHLVTGMFDTCRYESTLLTITSQLLDQDIFSNFTALKLSTTRGVRPLSLSCGICFKKLRSTSAADSSASILASPQVAVFHCRHAYHLDCLSKSESWEERVESGVSGLPEPTIVHLCLICKSRKDPNFEARRSFNPGGALTSPWVHSDDGASLFSAGSSRQKSTTLPLDEQLNENVERAFSRTYKSKRILEKDEDYSTSSSASSSFVRMRSSLASFSYSGYTYNASFTDSSIRLNLKPKVVPNKNIFDSKD